MWFHVAQAHHPVGKEPQTDDVVVARVYTTDPRRILKLTSQYDLWYYIHKQGYAVIRADRSRLPDDAVIDASATLALEPADGPFRGTGTLPARACYRTVEQTYADLQALALANPGLAQWTDFGDSWEKTAGLGGHDMQALVLGNQSIPGPKPVMMVISASHARELATAEAVTRFGEMLVNGYGVDPDITWMLDYFEVHLVSQHNPDGRKMAEAECTGSCSPSWRKNTNQNYCGTGSSLRGADLNRNADTSFWGGASSGSSECSTTYRGPSASSEPETSDLEAYIASVFPDHRDAPDNDFDTPADADADGVFISVHSSGDIVFYPWEGMNAPPPNLAGLRGLAQKMGFATTFAACQNCFLGPASGTNTDHVYERLGIAAFTFEIGTSFGQSCASFENTVLPQTLEGLFTALRHTHRAYQTPLGPDVLNVQFTPAGSGGLLTATADDSRRAVNGGGEPVDENQPIAQVRFTIGQPPWQAAQSWPLTPVDGAFDSAVEEAQTTVPDNLLQGAQIIFVYAEDADGNIGPPAAAWASTALFKSGFEH